MNLKKIITSVLIIVSIGLSAQNRKAQKKKKNVKKVVKQENLFDMFSETVTPVFSEGKKKKGFLELMNEVDLNPEQKQQAQMLYYSMGSKNLTKKQKDSLIKLFKSSMNSSKDKQGSK